MKRNYINKDYGYDKFIIFLKHSYFKRSCLTPFKNKLINELELRGICIKPFFSSNFTRNISRCNLCQSRLRGMYRNHIDMKQTGFTWDDNTIPEVNVLYIWLTDNKYYSDKVYSEKKTELEREILLIIAGLLGAKTVECKVKLHTNDILLVNEGIKASGVIEHDGSYENKNEETNDTKVREEYDNTGAGLLLRAPEFLDFKEQLNKKLRMIDDYTKKGICIYFNNSPELLLFAYKRSRLKLKQYNYQIKQEKISEKSIQIRNVMYHYGLCGKIKTTHSMSKIFTYMIDFYPLEELIHNYTEKFHVLYDKNKIENDEFYRIRIKYEQENIKMLDKNPEWIGNVQPMYDACLKFAEDSGYRNSLDKWIFDNPRGSFHSVCHLFKDKKDIIKWFDENIIKDTHKKEDIQNITEIDSPSVEEIISEIEPEETTTQSINNKFDSFFSFMM